MPVVPRRLAAVLLAAVTTASLASTAPAAASDELPAPFERVLSAGSGRSGVPLDDPIRMSPPCAGDGLAMSLTLRPTNTPEIVVAVVKVTDRRPGRHWDGVLESTGPRGGPQSSVDLSLFPDRQSQARQRAKLILPAGGVVHVGASPRRGEGCDGYLLPLRTPRVVAYCPGGGSIGMAVAPVAGSPLSRVRVVGGPIGPRQTADVGLVVTEDGASAGIVDADVAPDDEGFAGSRYRIRLRGDVGLRGFVRGPDGRCAIGLRTTF